MNAIFTLTQKSGVDASEEDELLAAERKAAQTARLKAVLAAAHADCRKTFMPDARQSMRAKSRHVASALISENDTISCRVINKGEEGMLLELLEEKACPAEFGLTVPALKFIGIVRREWRNGSKVGVSIWRL